MRTAEGKLLSAFSNALKGENVVLNFENSEEKLRFFHLAENHKVLPLLMDSCTNSSDYPYYAKRARQETITQAQRSADFLLLYEYLKEKGLSPLVLKGIICRALYPKPEQRLSSDEDFLVEPDDMIRYHEALLAYGLTPADPGQDISQAYEVTYTENESLLYIEVHTRLFSSSASYSRLNDLFTDAGQRASNETIYGVNVSTLSCQDHLLYLILHAYKHFIYSGFGIRQCADILLFSQHHQSEIKWNDIKAGLQTAGAFDFARAIYKIGLVHLLECSELARCLEDWDIFSINEMPLLEDILASGLYGASSFSRLHSSNITLHAASEGKKGSGVLRSVFLPLSSMKNRYPYLNRAPYLLPYAWVQRITAYMKETRHIPDDDMLKSIKIGRKRVELLKMYHIIPDEQ